MHVHLCIGHVVPITRTTVGLSAGDAAAPDGPASAVLVCSAVRAVSGALGSSDIVASWNSTSLALSNCWNPKWQCRHTPIHPLQNLPNDVSMDVSCAAPSTNLQEGM